MSIWTDLELAPTSDIATIRRAYARKLKVTQPEDDAEGFQRLRAAYEAALKLAKQAALTTVSIVVADATESESEPESEREDEDEDDSGTGVEHATPPAAPERDPDLVELETSFRALQAALQVGQTPPVEELRARLHAVIDSPALGNLSIFHTLETMLAALFAAAVPRSDPLIAECIDRFHWQQHENSLTPNPAVRIVLQRQSELDLLSDLESGRSPYSRAFAHLRRRQAPLARWWQAYKSEPAHSRELGLLAMIRDRYPRLQEMLEPREVEWWQRFATRPRVSYGMTRLAAFATVFAAIFGSLAGAGEQNALATGAKVSLATAGVSIGLILAKLYLIDWPTRLVTRRWSYRPPLIVQLGWLPVALFVAFLASVLPLHVAIGAVTGVVMIACALWAIYVAGPMPPAIAERQIHIQNSHLAQALTLNFILGLWWMISVQEWSDLSWNQYSIAAVGLMAITSFGRKPLVDFWFGRLTQSERELNLALLAVIAVMVGTLVWATASVRWMQGLNAALVVSVVALHRVPRGQFARKWYYAQAGVLVIGGVLLQVMHEASLVSYQWPITTLGGFLLLGSAVINLLITAYLDYRQLRAA